MQCQRCEKTATFHITELTGGKPEEVHLCKDCAREYLTQTEGEESPSAPNLASALAQQLVVGQAASELARLDQRACPVCGITFFEFRSTGRLGCPHDYVFFENELNPLILNIHGEVQHTGKRPVHFSGDTDEQTNLIRLRREMKEAVKDEKYEQASQLRDEIRRIEAAAAEARRPPGDG
ncbi:MAG: UvrB/UvrC motif-containing protein [Pirellulales bacterium]|nr:UvrB/UvrC motif-containing protein [Planctomycetales bacterium]